MNERMMKSVRDSMADVDLILLIVDASAAFGRGDDFTVQLLKTVNKKKLLLLNKIDLVEKKKLLPLMDRYSKAGNFEEILPISALTGENIEHLLTQIMKYLPEGPMFYPAEQITDQPERTIAAEMIREKLIVLTEEEMPYSTAVVIDRFEEDEKLYRIYASIFVERDSQKAIVIGKGGQKLKQVGTEARKEMESFFGRKVFLDLHVTVKKNWRDDTETLKILGLGE
jgi:GTP-binding protein Era